LRQSHTFKTSFVNEACLCHPIHPDPAILLVLFWTPCCDGYERSTICRLDASVNLILSQENPVNIRASLTKRPWNLSSHCVAQRFVGGGN
jgi:hypothetical protein